MIVTSVFKHSCITLISLDVDELWSSDCENPGWDNFQRKIRPFETVAREEFLVSEILRLNKLRIRLWKARKISRTKFLTENLTRKSKNFCEKGHWCAGAGSTLICSSYQLLNGSDTRTKSAKGEIKVSETEAWLARMESPALQNSYSWQKISIEVHKQTLANLWPRNNFLDIWILNGT